MSVAPTKGPWTDYAPSIRVEQGSPFKVIDENYRYIRGGSGVFPDGFCVVGFISPEDASVLSASRDLLDQLTKILAQAESWHTMHGHDKNSVRCDSICALIPSMKAAVRRALGEDSK